MPVKELTPLHMKKMSDNAKSNRVTIENYSKIIAMAVLAKSPCHMVERMRNRKKRMECCNNFWLTETYEASKVKQLLRTYLCHDRFCSNCGRIKQHIMKARFLPLMERHQHSLYHIVLTVPDCTGEELGDMVFHMGRCFKTLVNHLNGNQKIKGLDFSSYGYQGCIRSLEIECKGQNTFHPHFHVAAVFDNPAITEDKHISNRFSQFGKMLFSEFEIILQRMWWLIINRQRLSSEAILSEDIKSMKYSCIVRKFQPDDYQKLLGYIFKMRSNENTPMHFKTFRTLYRALNGVRQIQGYGIFYNAAQQESAAYTEQEYALLADYIAPGEQPDVAYEPLSHLARNTAYIILKNQYRSQ